MPNKTPEEIRLCLVKDCNNKYYAKEYCSKHYIQIVRYGKIRKRTRSDPNEFVDLNDGTTEIILYNIRCKETARALVDTGMIPMLKNYKWYLMESGYTATKTNNQSVYLHHLTMDKPPKGYETDHINRNKLDNRTRNLRVVTRRQNSLNQGIRSTNTSGYTGIYWHKKGQKWRASICCKGKNIHLGLFADKTVAVKARRDAEEKFFC